MNKFYSGFEKQASLKNKVVNFGLKQYRKTIARFRGGNKLVDDRVAIWNKKKVRQAAQDVADIANNSMKKDMVPQLDAFINRTVKKPFKIEPTLEKLMTFKGGILPALVVGASLEGGRQGVKGLRKLPGYIKSRQNQDQSKKK